MKKKKDIAITKNVKLAKLMNGRVKKKCENIIIDEKKEEVNEDVVNYDNLISKELFELCKVNKYHREYSSQLIHLSFLLYRLSPSGYELLRRYLPFPSHMKIYDHINKFLPQIISSLKEFKIYQMPHSTISFASKSSKPIPITLGIDAVCVVASSKYSNLPIENLYAFTIYLQPLLPEHKCLPVRIIESKSGIGNKQIVDILVDTSRQLESLNFSVHFLAFDGDHCYNVFHHWFFNSYEKFLISGDLFSIINKFKYKKNLPIGDPLHIMKNQKSRFLKCVICLDVSGSVFFFT